MNTHTHTRTHRHIISGWPLAWDRSSIDSSNLKVLFHKWKHEDSSFGGHGSIGAFYRGPKVCMQCMPRPPRAPNTSSCESESSSQTSPLNNPIESCRPREHRHLDPLVVCLYKTESQDALPEPIPAWGFVNIVWL